MKYHWSYDTRHIPLSEEAVEKRKEVLKQAEKVKQLWSYVLDEVEELKQQSIQFEDLLQKEHSNIDISLIKRNFINKFQVSTRIIEIP